MRRGYTLVEVLVVLVIFSIVIVIGTVLSKNTYNYMKVSKVLDESFDQINYSTRIVGIIQDFVNRFGRSLSEINIDSKSISGKIYVLSSSVEASLIVEERGDENNLVTSLILETDGNRKLLMEIPNVRVTFEQATSVSEDLGAVVAMTIERWSGEDTTYERMSRKTFIPLLNVR